MKVRIKRFDKGLPLPEYKTPKASSLDLYAREKTVIKSGEIGLIGLDVAVEIPDGDVGILVVRSSTYKLGLIQINGIGIIDTDYCGDEDEWKLAVWNFTKKRVEVEKGARIAQMLVLPRENIEWIETEKMGGKNRGGFGTTGIK